MAKWCIGLLAMATDKTRSDNVIYVFASGFQAGARACLANLARFSLLVGQLTQFVPPTVDDLLNRIKANCVRLLEELKQFNIGTSDLCGFHSAVLDLEKALFESDAQRLGSEINDSRKLCGKTLQFLLETLAAQTPRESSVNAPKFFIGLLLLFDLHLLDCLLSLTVYFKVTDSSFRDQSSSTAEEFPSDFTSEQHLNLADGLKLDIDANGLALDNFDILSRGLNSEAREQLARIIGSDEQLYLELNKLQTQIQVVRQGLEAHETFQLSNLGHFMRCLNQEVSRFIVDELESPLGTIPRKHFPLLNPVFNPVLCCSMAESENNRTSETTEEAATSDFDPLDLFETSEETVDHIEPPEELLESVRRLCADAGIADASWSLSTKSSQHIVVSGKGVTDQVKESLERKMAEDYPGYITNFVDAPLVSNNLSAIVLQRACNKVHPSVPWYDGEKATCELLLYGRQPHKDDRLMYYAVTSAHLLLRDGEMQELEDNKCQDRQLELIEKRHEVNKRIGEHVYLVRAKDDPQGSPPKHVHLCNPPLVSFRSYQHTADEKFYQFMTDIALIPFEFETSKSIRDLVQQSGIESISSILKLTPDQVKIINNSSKKVYAKGRFGTTVRMKEPLESDTDHPEVGIHIPFILDESCETFQPGDSGSLIYIKGQRSGDKIAIGILKGKRRVPEEHVYEAIVLQAAIDDIQTDYKHLVNSLKLYDSSPNVPRSGPIPGRANSAS